jgi:hypothetical protein
VSETTHNERQQVFFFFSSGMYLTGLGEVFKGKKAIL